MSFYPPKVNDRFLSPSNARELIDANASGTMASFECGSFVAFSLRIDEETNTIVDAGYRSNGCGFMIAAADVISDWLRGKAVVDLHGLNDGELIDIVTSNLEQFPPERLQCAAVVFDALRSTMAAYRLYRVEEFQGEKALICTCFGVSEDTIVAAIEANNFTDVDEVSAFCRAGSGCGSCRMLIQELIDSP